MPKLKIMVVDDSFLTIKKLTKILEDLGHQVVHIAKTGLDAVNAYKYVMPDLVTMDITPPLPTQYKKEPLAPFRDLFTRFPETKYIFSEYEVTSYFDIPWGHIPVPTRL